MERRIVIKDGAINLFSLKKSFAVLQLFFNLSVHFGEDFISLGNDGFNSTVSILEFLAWGGNVQFTNLKFNNEISWEQLSQIVVCAFQRIKINRIGDVSHHRKRVSSPNIIRINTPKRARQNALAFRQINRRALNDWLNPEVLEKTFGLRAENLIVAILNWNNNLNAINLSGRFAAQLGNLPNLRVVNKGIVGVLNSVHERVNNEVVTVGEGWLATQP